MKAALARTTESNTLEEVGRATLQIVHDLKNQLNGLKLYATFLRKRLEQDERAQEERETLAKLISGLDRAARDMTTLVKYAQPLEIGRRPHVDLRKMVTEIARDVAGYSKPSASITCDCVEAVYGSFDSVALSQALAAMTEYAIGLGAATPLAIRLRKANSTGKDEATIEWIRQTPAKPAANNSIEGAINVRKALAARIIEAHGGRIEFAADIIRAVLPLTN